MTHDHPHSNPPASAGHRSVSTRQRPDARRRGLELRGGKADGHTSARRVRTITYGAVLCGVSLAAPAQYASTSAAVNFYNQPFAACRDDSAVGLLVQAECGISNAVQDQSGVARAAADGAHLSVYAAATQTGGVGASTDVTASAVAVLQDHVAIHVPPESGLSGLRGTMDFDVHLSGVLLNATGLTPQVGIPAGSVAVSRAGLLLTVGATTQTFRESDQHRHYTDGRPGDLQSIADHEARINGLPVDTVFDTYSFQLPVTFEQGFQIYAELQVSAGVLGNAMSTGASIADAGKSFAWGGIRSITYQGQEVDGYTMSSSLGIDWTKSHVTPVPEPATAGLLCGGLAVVGALGRRRLRVTSRIGASSAGAVGRNAIAADKDALTRRSGC